MNDETNGEEIRDKAKHVMMMACTVGDGHTPSDSISQDTSPAMLHLGVDDQDHCVRTAIAAGCPRVLWKELSFVHEMMAKDGEPVEDDESD